MFESINMRIGEKLRGNIAAKLTIPSTVGIILVLILFSLAMLRISANVQEKQLDRATQILKQEKEKQEKHLRDNLNNYTRLIGEMLVLVAPEKMMTLDYEALDQITLLAQKDPNITYIKFKDANGVPLTTQKVKKLDKDGFVLKHDIFSWKEKLGEVEIGITNKYLKTSIKELEQATDALIAREKKEKSKNMTQLVKVSLFFTIVTCLVSFVVIYLSSRLITGPLSTLLEGIQRIRHDDFAHPVKIASQDELGEVSKIFNSMRVKLSGTLQELHEHKEQLEEKVELRTSEIHEKNLMLREVNHELKSAMNTIRATQEELLTAEKFAVAGQMAGIVAHEVLNPISAISLRIEANESRNHKIIKVIGKVNEIIEQIKAELATCKGDHPEQDLVKDRVALISKIINAINQDQKERVVDFAFLSRQINRVIKIVDSLRQMSKITRTIEPIKLDDLIREVLEDMKDSFKKRQIEVIERLDNVASIKADHMELHSIISNLTRNAIQAIEHQTNIENARAIYINLKTLNNGFLCLEISDTGIGVAPKDWETIFEPNFTSKGREGTGLGLSYTRKLARGYGGDIRIKESELERGTTFEVIIGGRSEDGPVMKAA